MCEVERGDRFAGGVSGAAQPGEEAAVQFRAEEVDPVEGGDGRVVGTGREAVQVLETSSRK